MKFVVLTIALASAIASPAIGQTSSTSTRAATSDERAVLERERDVMAAYTRGDTAALGRLLADDLTATSPGGFVATKRDVVAAVGAYRGLTFDATRLRARAYGDAAVVTGILTLSDTQGGRDERDYLRVTDTFVRQRGGWRLAASQQTHVPVWLTRAMDDRDLAPATALECGQESSLKSLNSDVAAYLKFTNAGAHTVRVHWLNYDGRRDPAADQVITIAPGTSGFRFTYVTHPFVATDTTGTCLGIYQPARAPSRAVLR